jgi:hypothetical protein
MKSIFGENTAILFDRIAIRIIYLLQMLYKLHNESESYQTNSTNSEQRSHVCVMSFSKIHRIISYLIFLPISAME